MGFGSRNNTGYNGLPTRQAVPQITADAWRGRSPVGPNVNASAVQLAQFLSNQPGAPTVAPSINNMPWGIPMLLGAVQAPATAPIPEPAVQTRAPTREQSYDRYVENRRRLLKELDEGSR